MTRVDRCPQLRRERASRVVRILLASLGLLAAAPAWCNDIVEVLERSQTMRMQAQPPASERAARVHASFERLAGVMALPGRVELRIVGGGVYAEAMLGHVIVASGVGGRSLPSPRS
jgi:hypothetical protein